MILAQTATHLNPLYHEWGHVPTVVALMTATIAGVVWILKQNSDDTRDAGVKIRTMLTGLLEHTFRIEMLRIFELIDDLLPYALSQVGADNPHPSAFDRLCVGLREIEPGDPNRVKYQALLEQALSKIIIGSAKKLLDDTETPLEPDAKVRTPPTRMLFSFKHETDNLLAYIAKETTRCKKKEHSFRNGKLWATRLLITAVIALILALPWVRLDTKWAYWLETGFEFGGYAAGVAGLASLYVVFSCQHWIAEHAKWGRKDWLDDCERSNQG